MKLNFALLLLIVLFSFSLLKANTLEKNQSIYLIRHALAPGNGDPINFDLLDCSTQRNLNDVGILQSKEIGQFFSKNNIKIDDVYSSQWCRCKDTASYAFNNFKELSFLNSFYSYPYNVNRDEQMRDLRTFISELEYKSNVVFVTHYVVIADLVDYYPKSGEIIQIDKDLNIINTFLIN